MVSSLKSWEISLANLAVVRVSHPTSAGPGVGSMSSMIGHGAHRHICSPVGLVKTVAWQQAAAAGSLLPLRQAHLTPVPVSTEVTPGQASLCSCQGCSEDLGSRCSRGVHWSLPDANSGLLQCMGLTDSAPPHLSPIITNTERMVSA